MLNANKIAGVGAVAIDGVIEGKKPLVGYVICTFVYRDPKPGATKGPIKEIGFGSNLPSREAGLQALAYALDVASQIEPTHVDVVRKTKTTQ